MEEKAMRGDVRRAVSGADWGRVSGRHAAKEEGRAVRGSEAVKAGIVIVGWRITGRRQGRSGSGERAGGGDEGGRGSVEGAEAARWT